MNKIKSVLLLLILSIGVQLPEAYSQSNVDARRAKLISVIDEQLAEITRLNKRMGSQNPDYLLRMAELLLEKARLIKEQENMRFLGLAAEQRSKVNKNDFFKASRSYFEQAQRTCAAIVQRFPNYKNKGDVYYIMAYNAKEFGEIDKAEKFFNQAVKVRTSDEATNNRARLALADIYFNKSEFAKTIPLYESALRNSTKDKWWTKDSYNLAWSYFRTKQSDKAISKMEEVFQKSKDPNYVDMSFQVERDLGYFYADSNRVGDAVTFYRRNKQNVPENLIKIASYLNGQGNFAASEKVLNEAKKHKENDSQDVDIHLALLALYERNNQYEGHLAASKVLARYNSAGKLNKTQQDTLKYQVERMSAILQKQVVDKNFKGAKSIQDRRAELAVEYFTILGSINPNESYKTTFHTAETLYANGDFNKAVELYDQVIPGATQANDTKILKLAQNGMLAALGGKGVTQATKNKYMTKAYIAYLAENPKDSKSYTIYQRLFNDLMEKKDVVNAEKTLMAFKQNYPNDFKIQEAMMAKIMDHHKDTNNREGIYAWVQRINEGEFKVSKQYADKVRQLLLSMQFENVETANKSGDKTNALRGYVAIYKHPSSSEDAKKNAAYNVAVLFYELGDAPRMYAWTQRALSHLNSKDVIKFESSFLSIAAELVNQRRFKESIHVYETTFNKICSEKSNNKKLFFKNAIVISISEGDFNKTTQLLDNGARCGIDEDTLTESQIDYLVALSEDGRWSAFRDALSKYEQNRKTWPLLIYPNSQLAKAYLANGRTSEAEDAHKKMLRFYDHSVNAKLAIPLEGLDAVADLRLPELQREIDAFERIQLRFPEKEYDALLKQKIAQIEKINAKAFEIMSTRSGKAILYSYRKLIEAYEALIAEVTNFIPPDKEPAYVESFRKGMQGLANALQAQANENRGRAIERIKKDKILSSENSWFTHLGKQPFSLEYHMERPGILMDKGGKR